MRLLGQPSSHGRRAGAFCLTNTRTHKARAKSSGQREHIPAVCLLTIGGCTQQFVAVEALHHTQVVSGSYTSAGLAEDIPC